jgi:hypothetical protein
MPGNEKEVLKFIINNRSKLILPLIGLVRKIEIPREDELVEIINIKHLDTFYSDDANKKADIFINGKGISIKQSGGAPLYNKAQREFLIKFFNFFFNVKTSNMLLNNLDMKVKEFHKAIIKRDINFLDIMNDSQFKVILRYLMLEGSAQLIDSKFKAEFILIANKVPKLKEDIEVYEFDEYYKKFQSNIVLALRRVWIGQRSDSEHNRAKAMFAKKENRPWCFDNVSGLPDIHKKHKIRWREEISPKERKTIYYININQQQ